MICKCKESEGPSVVDYDTVRCASDIERILKLNIRRYKLDK